MLMLIQLFDGVRFTYVNPLPTSPVNKNFRCLAAIIDSISAEDVRVVVFSRADCNCYFHPISSTVWGLLGTPITILLPCLRPLIWVIGCYCVPSVIWLHCYFGPLEWVVNASTRRLPCDYPMYVVCMHCRLSFIISNEFTITWNFGF